MSQQPGKKPPVKTDPKKDPKPTEKPAKAEPKKDSKQPEIKKDPKPTVPAKVESKKDPKLPEKQPASKPVDPKDKTIKTDPKKPVHKEEECKSSDHKSTTKTEHTKYDVKPGAFKPQGGNKKPGQHEHDTPPKPKPEPVKFGKPKWQITDRVSKLFGFLSNKQAYTDTSIFLDGFYAKEGLAETLCANKAYAWMGKRVGAEKLQNPSKEDAKLEPVENAANPGWSCVESWRIINLFNILITSGAPSPITDLIQKSHQYDVLTEGLFPSDVITLLLDNERTIMESHKAWVGLSAQPDASNRYPPFDGVRLAHTAQVKYYQTGGVGPLSLEASFILATQLAGINWKTLHDKCTVAEYGKGRYWLGAVVPGQKEGPILEPWSQHHWGSGERRLGRLLPAPKDCHDEGAGWYLALDVDDVDTDDKETYKTKKVFVFAVHLIDTHSRLKNGVTDLSEFKYTRYTPGGHDAPLKSPNDKDEKAVRFYAHAHAAVWSNEELQKWIGAVNGTNVKMPDYKQVSEHHFYFHTENYAPWPRKSGSYKPT